MKRSEYSIEHLQSIHAHVEARLQSSCDIIDSVKSRTKFVLLISVGLLSSSCGYLLSNIGALSFQQSFGVHWLIWTSLISTVILIYSSFSYRKNRTGLDFSWSFQFSKFEPKDSEKSRGVDEKEIAYKTFLISTAAAYQKHYDKNMDRTKDKIIHVKLASAILSSNLILIVVYLLVA